MFPCNFVTGGVIYTRVHPADTVNAHRSLTQPRSHSVVGSAHAEGNYSQARTPPAIGHAHQYKAHRIFLAVQSLLHIMLLQSHGWTSAREHFSKGVSHSRGTGSALRIGYGPAVNKLVENW